MKCRGEAGSCNFIKLLSVSVCKLHYFLLLSEFFGKPNYLFLFFAGPGPGSGSGSAFRKEKHFLVSIEKGGGLVSPLVHVEPVRRDAVGAEGDLRPYLDGQPVV